ncbi:FAD-dependent oxidoreductase [Streptomyces zagrosensis]|uniref:Glycine/D-amino acid oxidase-like deaminating enzyme/nitrite reductase/ring-hydroxylating ferredoxin subunit n=1 Tax=Streptomyces zagrosensis TaxID=1042984 RepID=A0A7W9UXW2_9ACTN|nr:FAD-dependent oxidoreductase [Streptomyces zagrosensis]MBB5935042.1 glycine/D-amino acid oxidase-like deaminating enzyme/nitrite reductase/ring-hydroxylating ferredoxin subunit [Streptomyces zagrosensis]
MTSLPGIDESYWMDSTPATDYPHVPADATTDVAVIGGGMAGLCTAWELVCRGRSVVLLEADRIAAGVTGYTTAKVSALHTLIYATLRDTHGARATAHYATSQQEAIRRIERTAVELGVDCQWERADAYTYATDPSQLGTLRAEARAAADAGLDASFVTETDLPFAVAGAVRVSGQAQFHPRRYLLALAKDITARGGQIYERSRVTGLREGTPCRVTTESGAVIKAQDVVVATHYPIFDRALMFARLEPTRELVVAATLPADQAPSGMYITPEGSTRSVRTAPWHDGQRLLIATGEKFTPGTGTGKESGSFERLTDWLTSHFPAAEPAYRWAAQDNFSSDRVPFVGPFHPGARQVYVATGFGGWGISNGAMAGTLLADLITGEKPPHAGLYDPRRLHPIREAGRLLDTQATVAKHFIGDRLRSTQGDDASDIAPGSGALVRVGGSRCAVYRDEDGTPHAVSARCTHLGCLVRFNDAERTWECPCHGSRFGVDGSVLQGPAVRPLERRELPDDGF